MASITLSYTDQDTKRTYTLQYGRNAAENWQLFDDAESDDLWFHIDDLPSAHVYLQASKDGPSQSAIDYAASLLLHRSPKAVASTSTSKKAKKIPVIYTPRSNLAKGRSVGEVLIKDLNLLFRISIDPSAVQSK